jgi:hypothetical protein
MRQVSAGQRRTAHLPMAPFCLNDDLTA